MKRAFLAATALAFAALVLPGAQAADAADGKTGTSKSRASYFDRIDADKDGAVTLEEVTAAHSARLAKIDADGNGAVSRDEFMASGKASGKAKASERKAKYFDRLDADKDGTISGEEWHAVAQTRFAALDADKDGKVTKEELAAARDKHRKTRAGGEPAKGGETDSN